MAVEALQISQQGHSDLRSRALISLCALSGAAAILRVYCPVLSLDLGWVR